MLPGCAHHSIREGIWELTFKATVVQTHKPLDIPPRAVKVKLGWDGEGEIAEIADLSGAHPSKVTPSEGSTAQQKEEPNDSSSLGLKPMFADIRVKREGESPTVKIDHQDGYWNWGMHGIVRSPTVIQETNFFARYKYGDGTILNGGWSMRWLRDS